MPKLMMEIDCDNTAFVGMDGRFSPEPELVYILTDFVKHTLAVGLERFRGGSIVIRDSQGNKVGKARMVEGE